jgi:hypothetical protein
MRRFLGLGSGRVMLAVVLASLVAVTAPVAASGRQAITIETTKPFGPVPGTFSATGALAVSGTMVNLGLVFSGIGAPTFAITHPTILFTGTGGTFTIKAQIVETVTADPLVLSDTGTWTIIDGTGEYSELHGQGTVTGTADDNIGLISRTYEGTVQLD